jgi:hypothetical protein
MVSRLADAGAQGPHTDGLGLPQALPIDRIPAPTEPLPGRSCNGCTLCCKVMGVPELRKPRGSWCVHCVRGLGCRIYSERPAGCRSFLCGWLTNPRFGPEWKPDRSKIVVTVGRDGNGLEFQCDPGFPEAWRKEPYYGDIKRLSAIAEEHDGMVSVQAGRNMIIISPDSEFLLGEVREEDEIIREFEGRRLVGVRVVKAGGRPERQAHPKSAV